MKLTSQDQSKIKLDAVTLHAKQSRRNLPHQERVKVPFKGFFSKRSATTYADLIFAQKVRRASFLQQHP